VGVSLESSSRSLNAPGMSGSRRSLNSASSGLHESRSAAAWAAGPVPRSPRVERLHELAQQGRLADVAASAGRDERQYLFAAAYDMVWPIVFTRITRRVEQRRGHMVCSLGVDRLADECLDRFHDDVEAVVDDLLTHARRPVFNLEAWVAGRLNAATVNGHRRLRGERGALQRPRLPGWLGTALGQDRWLCALATEILVWVGARESAGTGIWPLEAWAQQRGVVTSDWRGSAPATVAREVETVLAVMRRRPDWYESYVERPPGHKQAPVSALDVSGVDRPLVLTEPHHDVDAEMLRLAADAVTAIDRRITAGEEAQQVVVEVIRSVFGRTVSIAGLDRAPHAAADPRGGLTGALTDMATVNRIVATVREIIEGR
jgi:hypothetical protein